MAEIEIKTINFFKFENSEQANKKITPEKLESIFLYFLYWQMNKEKFFDVDFQSFIESERNKHSINNEWLTHYYKNQLYEKLRSIRKYRKRAISWEYKTFFNDRNWSEQQFTELIDFFHPNKSEKSIKNYIRYNSDDDDPLYLTF